jgi:4-hydroxy-tetrahydrodipicolinate reductase
MLNILLSGACGRMGREVIAVAGSHDVCVLAGIDVKTDQSCPVPVYPDFDLCEKGEAKVLLDFTRAENLHNVLAYAVKNKMTLVLAATGYTEKDLQAIRDAARVIPIFRSANMSLGVHVLKLLSKKAAELLPGFDIEIVEKHHNQKVDSPSGTALALADSINDALTEKYDYVYDRSERRMKRPVKEIGISAIRGGTIVGDHDVIFAGQDEVITFSHRAYSRAVFGKGAVEAAKFLAAKPAGLYSMHDVLA